KMYEPLRQLAKEQTISYSFVSGDAFGGESKFYVLDIPSQNITEFQERVRNLPDSLEPTAKPTPPPPPLPISGEWTPCASEMQQQQARERIISYLYFSDYTFGRHILLFLLFILRLNITVIHARVPTLHYPR